MAAYHGRKATERERERETDRQTDRKRQREREREILGFRERDRQRERERERLIWGFQNYVLCHAMPRDIFNKNSSILSCRDRPRFEGSHEFVH